MITPDQSEERTREYLDELAFLADTHGIVPVKRFTQRLPQPNIATYVGEGKTGGNTAVYSRKRKVERRKPRANS